MGHAMSGKVVVVTGANQGIGKEAARAIAKEGAEVILVCRSEEKGREALADIQRDSGNDNVHLMLADMSSQKSIRDFAAAFKKKYTKLDVLLNNAGVVLMERKTTVDGLEATFATNHLGYFLTTLLLIDELKAADGARVINVSSEMHPRSKGISFDDLQHEKRYSGMDVYAETKLANVLFTYELARRLEGTRITVNALHPGVIASGFGRNNGGFFGAAIRLGAPFLTTPEKGAVTSVYLATSPDVANVTGKYFIKRKPARSSKRSYDEAAQLRLWNESLALTGLSDTLQPRAAIHAA